jgi:hypothetical protein
MFVPKKSTTVSLKDWRPAIRKISSKYLHPERYLQCLTRSAILRDAYILCLTADRQNDLGQKCFLPLLAALVKDMQSESNPQ